jgi:hypothetical protein
LLRDLKLDPVTMSDAGVFLCGLIALGLIVTVSGVAVQIWLACLNLLTRQRLAQWHGSTLSASCAL